MRFQKFLSRLMVLACLFLGVGQVKAQGYKLPFPGGTNNIYCTRDGYTHCSSNCYSRYAYDFSFSGVSLTDNYTVVAARSGTIRRIEESKSVGGRCISSDEPNYVVVDHGDGTEALYLHLKVNSVPNNLYEGASILQGEPLGIMGNVGFTCGVTGMHLHFQVQNSQGTSWWKQSIPNTFEDVNGEVVSNGTYTSQNYPTLAINQSLNIYGGSVSSPKKLDIYIDVNSYNLSFNTANVQNIKITDGTTNYNIPTSRILSTEFRNVGNKYWRHIILDVRASDIAGLTNSHTFRSISFDLNDGGTIRKYQNQNLYFVDPANFTDMNNANDWAEAYIRKGVGWGLFRGNSATTFNPTGNLTRGQAALVLISAAVKLERCNINISTTNGSFQDVDRSSSLFPYIQTMRNYGWAAANTTFRPNDPINVGEFCQFIRNVFEIQATDIAPNSYLTDLNRKIRPQHTNATLQEAMETILKLIDITDESTGFWKTEAVWEFFDYGVVRTIYSTDIFVVDGTLPLNRAIMSKVLTNLVSWKANKLGITLNFDGSGIYAAKNMAPNITDMIAIGEKYDNTATPSGNAPNSISQQNFTGTSGSSMTLAYPSDYDAAGNPQHFYWSMQKNGATIASNTATHRSITFTAPTVTQQTQWKLYSYVANNKGKARENYITITVNPAVAPTPTAPTIQAANLSVTGQGINSISLQWQRGNGQSCIVVGEEVGANAMDAPQTNTVYSGNSNLTTAPSVFSGSNTKVLYTGTGNTLTVAGLDANTTYRFAVYEYNGTTAANVRYLVANPAYGTGATMALQPYNVSISFTPNTIIVGQPVTFCAESTLGNCSATWTNSGGTQTSTSTNCQTVVFNSNGTYNVSVLTNHCIGNRTASDAINIRVYSPNQILPDFSPSNFSSDKTALSVNGGTVNLSFNVRNSGLTRAYLAQINYYLSSDIILDANDRLIFAEGLLSSIEITPNNGITHNKNLTLPSNMTTGQFYIIAQVDALNQVVESSESNNTGFVPITISPALPDFIIQNVSLPNGNSYSSGTPIPINVTINNVSPSSANYSGAITSFYLSSNNDFYDSEDWVQAGGIDWNGNFPTTLNFTPVFDRAIPNGTYNLIVELDGFMNNPSNNRIIEINENNNKFIVRNIVISNPSQPQIGASNPVISNFTSDGLKLSWTNGNGNGRIVIITESMPFSYSHPIDGQIYTVNTNYSNAPSYNSCRVVYSGNSNFTNITGLRNGITYYFSIYEYNHLSSIDYLQSKPAIIATHFRNTAVRDWETILTASEDFSIIKFDNNNTLNALSTRKGYMMQSTDNGDTWVLVPYTTKENAVLIGSNINAQFLSNGKGWLWDEKSLKKTDNGGLSWQKINIESNNVILSSAFLGLNYTYIVGRHNSDTLGYIYRSLDEGQSWVTTIVENKLYSIFFIDPLNGFAAGNNGFVIKTTDGGITWRKINVNSVGQNPISFRKITALNSSEILVAGHNGQGGVLYRSSNGGNSWSLVLNLDNYQLGNIEFENAHIGYASAFSKFQNSSANYIYKTIDAGHVSDTLTIKCITLWNHSTDVEYIPF